MNNVAGIILSCSGVILTKREIDFFQSINPLGFILFGRNFDNKKQINSLILQLKEISKNPDLLIFIDQEGGKVQRLKNSEFIEFPPQNEFGKIYIEDENLALDLAYKSSYLMGAQLKEVGVDVDFSPVCDLFYDDAHDIIGNRSFGKKPTLVFKLSSIFCDGLLDSGIIPVPKHFPGHGRSLFDTHLKRSIINVKYEELVKTDLVPFQVLEKSLFVMLAHIIYPQIDKHVVTYSTKIIRKILRKDFKFRGLVLSDDISMKALNEDILKRITKTQDAGCDVILYCKGDLKEMIKIYPHIKDINKEQYSFFLNELKKIKTKKKNLNKFKADLIEYNLIKNAS